MTIQQNLSLPISGHIEIQVTDMGYKVDVNSGQTIIQITTPGANITKNSIGFFTDHYNHGCSKCGFFMIKNFDITAKIEN